MTSRLVLPLPLCVNRLTNKQVEKFSPEEEIRAVVEGPLMAKLCHAQQLGYHVDSNTRILVTGGASENQTILQVQSELKVMVCISNPFASSTFTLLYTVTVTVQAEILTVILIWRLHKDHQINLLHYQSIYTTSMGFSPYSIQNRQFKILTTVYFEQTAKYNAHQYFCLYGSSTFIEQSATFQSLL